MIKLFPPTQFKFTINGRDVLVQRIAGGKGKLPKLAVTIPGPFGGRLHIRYENAFDRFFKKIGLDVEPQIPNRDLNDRLYFECDDQEFVNRVFSSGDFKFKILDLLAQGYTVSIQPQKCVFRRNLIDGRFDEKECEELARMFVAMTMSLPTTSETNGAPIRFQIIKTLLLTMGYATLAAGGVVFCFSLTYGMLENARLTYPVVESAQCWGYASQYFVPAILIAVIMGFGAIRGFATSSRIYINFVLSFCIGAVVLGYFGTQYVNGKNDEATPTSFVQPVVHKYTTRGKSTTYYHLSLAPWRAGGSRFSFDVDYGTYEATISGKTRYTITTKPGALGLEWVTGYSKYDDPETTSADIEINWPPRNYRQWYPLPNVTDIDPMEMAYWQEWLKVIEEGITNRMNVHDYFNRPQHSTRVTGIKNEYWRRQTQILERLNQIQPPERLRTFHETVLDASHDQIEFYVDFGTAKEDNGKLTFENVADNPHLKNSDQKLWAAYHQFEALYPQRSNDFNDAIEKRLAWFDSI
jgi:hypothetical protein